MKFKLRKSCEKKSVCSSCSRYYLSCSPYENTAKILLYALLDPHDLGLKSQFSRVGSQETINTIAWKRTETINNGDN